MFMLCFFFYDIIKINVYLGIVLCYVYYTYVDIINYYENKYNKQIIFVLHFQVFGFEITNFIKLFKSDNPSSICENHTRIFF